MLERITLKNFQSHKNTEILLDKGVNVVIGQSDSGKTAIIRALKWLRYNRPSGEAYRSHWGGSTEVCVHTAEGVVITRQRDKTDMYRLGAAEFKAFGVDVPLEIQEALNINEVNMQFQLDKPFLLMSSPGEVANHFNKIAKLEQIDNTRKGIEKALNQKKEDLRRQEANEKEHKTELEKYAYLEKLEQAVEVLEEMEAQVQGLRSSQSKLKTTVNGIAEAEEEIQQYKPLISLEPKVRSLCAMYDELVIIEKDKESLLKLHTRLEELSAQIEEDNTVVAQESLVLPLLKQYEELANLKKQKKILQNLMDDLEENNSKEDTGRQQLKTLEKEYKDTFPDVCPFCGSSNIKKSQTPCTH